MKKLNFSLVFLLALAFTQKSYADNISFADAVKMSRLKNSQTKNSKSNVSAKVSFAQAVKLQKQKTQIKPGFARLASFNENVDSSYTNSSDSNSLKSFILKRNPNVSNAMAEQIVSEVTKHCYKHSIEPKLIIALMTIESNFNRTAVSPVGAMGLGQLMPGTAGDLGVNDAFNISQNIKGTVNYLSQLLKTFNGNLELSLASYNMGPNAVKKSIENNSDIPSSVKDYVYNIKYIRSVI